MHRGRRKRRGKQDQPPSSLPHLPPPQLLALRISKRCVTVCRRPKAEENAMEGIMLVVGGNSATFIIAGLFKFGPNNGVLGEMGDGRDG